MTSGTITWSSGWSRNKRGYTREMRHSGGRVTPDWFERGVRVVTVTQQIDLSGAVGRLGATAIPDPLETHLAGHVPTVVRLEVIERPFDDDPPQLPELIVQLGLELVA